MFARSCLLEAHMRTLVGSSRKHYGTHHRLPYTFQPTVSDVLTCSWERPTDWEIFFSARVTRAATVIVREVIKVPQDLAS